MLRIITNHLSEDEIPYALIGAFALNIYGLPRFTADIDLLTEGRFWPRLSPIMERLGYTCFQNTKTFARFDSELGVYGKVDFMFVNSPEGRGILEGSVNIEEALLGEHPVIQPTDYIVLKLMAIANNPERSARDENDISAIIQLNREGLISDAFEPIDKTRIYEFANRFGQRKLVEKYLNRVEDDAGSNESNRL